ncbi:MarR family transcriptional regulator [Paenibacillus rhizovicinus]|uniref:MarR family transcriptional regulator n=1 Tax=Paenibacillus rhizovicinus TaxID=2704463 RepID=A0A6C0P8R3_9BACL|nr:MarR family transcriptional regulator [Paenibacillus rhizovicinus]QHW34806.1 MarR family transcriptional regulator [Paenibacillus rhizovicinus]
MERWLQSAKNRMKTLENPLNLANGHIFVLKYLHRVETCKVNDVAKLLGITSGAATGLTDKLVSLGLIERTRPEEDRRVVLLSLTESGKETIESTWKQRHEWFTSIVGQLEESQVDVILDAFKLLFHLLEDKQEQNKEV